MNDVNLLGKVLILMGIILIILGIIFFFSSKIPILGRLPGDIYIQKKNFSFYFPITTCILISIILSVVFWLWVRK
jgi:uncharacterized membrane protein YidH (DUF202 family)